jgi:hypothetical protein
MTDAVAVGGVLQSSPGTSSASYERPEFLEWLDSGRLTLVGECKQAVSVEQWARLPLDQRMRVLAEFDRVVRSNTKAAVLFVK